MSQPALQGGGHAAKKVNESRVSVGGAKRLKLILLDACRTNPFVQQMRRTSSLDVGVRSASSAGGTFAARSVDRGLGQIKVSDATLATLVVYAAKHGQTALDGEGNNSPFAIAIVQRIATPNVEINKLFRLVRDDVLAATGNNQEVFEDSSLPGTDFFFRPRLSPPQ